MKKDEVKLKIINVMLKGGSVDLPFLPIDDYDKIFKELNFFELELIGDETNGREVDFCYTYFDKDKYKYYLTGSLFYGRFKLRKIS